MRRRREKAMKKYLVPVLKYGKWLLVAAAVALVLSPIGLMIWICSIKGF